MISYEHLAGIMLIFTVFVIISFISKKKVNNLSDFFISGRKMGTFYMTGGIVSAFMGGTSTIGTAQMGYEYGISGIFVTLGGGLACLLIALFLLRIYKDNQCETIAQILALTYGNNARSWVAIYTSIGIFVQVFVQIVATIPLFKYIFGFNMYLAGVVALALIILNVIFSGMWGSSSLGIIKILLLFLTLFIAGGMSLKNIGVAYAAGTLPVFPYLNLFPRGIARELFNGISMVVGFMSTQTFIQPIFGARDYKSARFGLILSAVLLPLFGLASVLIGINMHTINPNLNSVEALPYFLIKYLNPWLGGLALGTILFSVLTSGAALILSITTLITRDVIEAKVSSISGERLVLFTRACIVCVGLLGLGFAFYNVHALLLDWTYFSNVIRGVTVFIPFLFSATGPKLLNQRSGFLAITAAPLASICWFLIFGNKFPVLIVGLTISLCIMLWGVVQNVRAQALNTPDMELAQSLAVTNMKSVGEK